jgi:hypothetical protein
MGNRSTSSPGRDAAEMKVREKHNWAVHDRNAETLKQASRQGGGGGGSTGCAVVILGFIAFGAVGALGWLFLV